MTTPLDVEGLKRVAEAFSKDDVSAFGAQLPRFTPAFVLNLLARIEEVEGENRRLQTEVLNAAFSDRLDMEAGGSPLTWKEIALSAEAALVSLKGGGGSSGGGVQAAPDGATEAQHSAGEAEGSARGEP